MGGENPGGPRPATARAAGVDPACYGMFTLREPVA